ncbi:MAG TPA: alpha/beta hydrolase [Nocardioidaceae bacterium]|nr:alpha/beta hydrolase [Nocardioidaceae bacterium]
MTTSHFLQRPEGRLAYDVHGSRGGVHGSQGGPWVVCVPGMGDLRQSYRLLVPLLVRRGYRVATLDLRGHGDSDATFSAYDDEALASDLVALLGELDGPAVLVGNSMGAGGAVIAAAEAPERVAGLALLGPFVRNPPGGGATALLLRLALRRPWGPAVWMAYYRKLFPGSTPPGHEEHVAAVRGNLRRPGHWRAFVATSRTSHAPAEAHLPGVSAPTVVVMGEADPDWKDPAAEAAWVAERLDAELVMLPDVGHYPQAQASELTADAVTRLVDGASRA